MYNSVITYQPVSILEEGHSPMSKGEGFLSSALMKELRKKLTNFVEEYMPTRTSV
jgi:hypothetical protein